MLRFEYFDKKKEDMVHNIYRYGRQLSPVDSFIFFPCCKNRKEIHILLECLSQRIFFFKKLKFEKCAEQQFSSVDVIVFLTIGRLISRTGLML